MTLNRTVADLGERALIERITRRLALPPWVVVGPGDDAAVIKPERGSLDVLTTDAQIEGVHFDRRFVPPDAIGHRALAVNLSDLAAMGAEPRAALLSLALPDALDASALDGMLDGLLALAARHRVALVGGNVTRSPGPIVLDITAIGAVRPRRILTRAGARPADEVYVTGAIGEALVGLRLLQQAQTAHEAVSDAPIDRGANLFLSAEASAEAEGLPGKPDPSTGSGSSRASSRDERLAPQACEVCVERYRRPAPRVRAGLLLGRNRAASACIDLSDGLGDGVRQIAEASGVGITIEAETLPISSAVRAWHAEHGNDPVSASVAGGDDYELLFTVRPALRARLRAVRQHLRDVPITKIGVVTKERGVWLRTSQGQQELPRGFEHFR